MGEVIYIDEYLERKTKPKKADIQRRLAEIGIEQMVLASERERLKQQLETTE